jgi:hypothetical protein
MEKINVNIENRLSLKDMSTVIGGGNTRTECQTDTYSFQGDDIQVDVYNDDGAHVRTYRVISQAVSTKLESV